MHETQSEAMRGLEEDFGDQREPMVWIHTCWESRISPGHGAGGQEGQFFLQKASSEVQKNREFGMHSGQERKREGSIRIWLQVGEEERQNADSVLELTGNVCSLLNLHSMEGQRSREPLKNEEIFFFFFFDKKCWTERDYNLGWGLHSSVTFESRGEQSQDCTGPYNRKEAPTQADPCLD